MDKKTTTMKNSTSKIKQRVVLYHIISPIDSKQFTEIQTSGYFKPSENALGGQSDGYYFFTTHQGAQYHIDSNKDMWKSGVDKNAYIVECEIDMDDVKYPIWKLDYEAMQDFLFDMIYNAALEQDIICEDIKITALDSKKLALSYKKKFSRISGFSADIHSGLVEKIADYLYKNNLNFRNAYDKLLKDVLSGNGDDKELYAIKTTQKQKISKMTKIEKEQQNIQTVTQSPIDKFLSRYGRGRR